MTLCILASILVFVIAKRPKAGLILTVVIFLASIVATFMVAFVHNYNGLLKLYMP